MRGTIIVATASTALLLAGGAAGFDVVTESSNRVDNHEFRKWQSGDPVHWVHKAGAVAPVDDPVDGSYDGESTRANLTFGGGYSSWIHHETPQSLGEDAPIVPNATYSLTFMAEFQPRDTDDGEWIFAGALLVWEDSSGRYVGSEAIFVDRGSAYDWYGGTFEAPLEATQADLELAMVRSTLGAYDDASFHVDDVHFWRE